MNLIRVEFKQRQGGSVQRISLISNSIVKESWQVRESPSDVALEKIVKEAKIPRLTRQLLREMLDKGDGEYDFPETTFSAPLQVFIRGINETENKARCYEGIEPALSDTTISSAEPIIYWRGTDRLCAVDADFHTFPFDQRPSVAILQGRYSAISPTPYVCWVTHGRGIRLIYKAMEGYDADELAAVGAARLLQLEPMATVELKSSTRHPQYPNASGRTCSAVERRQPTTDCRAILGWYEGRSEADDEDVKEWLENQGYEIGGRYEHNRCPVDPGTPSHGTPVVCYENGIFCYGCAGHGIRRGTRAPGWFPFSVFVGRPSVSVIAKCVEHFTHWEHARFILASTYALSNSILRGAYSAMLKGKHGIDEPRIPAVFSAGHDIVRFARYWGTLEGESFSTNRADAIIAKFPACQFVDVSGKIGIDSERVARFLQATSLERYGYPHLRPVWGLPIYAQHLEPKYPYEITMFKGPGKPPQYLRPEQRISEAEAWGRMQQAFPGINRNAVKLLIAAKGCAEADGTFPPLVFITGSTSCAKSTSVVVSAAICGDRVSGIPGVSDDARIRAALMESKNSGTFAVFNEAVKEGRRTRIGKAEAMEFVLGLTPDSVSHKLYVGPVVMGTLPVCVWTDVYVPQEVKEHSQLARRFVHIHLNNKVDWHRTMRETGMGKAEWLRLGGREYVEAADAILSIVIDECFSAPATFEEIANQLGFKTLSESDDAKLQEQELLAFYELYKTAPKQDGWAIIDLNDASKLSHLWRDLADRPDFRSSQRISEVDFALLLGGGGHIIFHTNCKGSKMRVKFEEVNRAKKTVHEVQNIEASEGGVLPEFPTQGWRSVSL